MRYRVLTISIAVLSFGCGRAGLTVPGESDTSPTPPPQSYYGTGLDKDLTIDTDTEINVCAQLINTEPAVGVRVTDWDDAQPVNRLILLHQAQDLSPRQSGDSAPVTNYAAIGNAGIYELVRVTSVDPVDGNGLRLIHTSPPPVHDFAKNDPQNDGATAQMCTVPEFDNLTIESGSSLRAPVWDQNFFGGIVFAYVDQTLDLQGSIVATASGFWGRNPAGNDTSTDQVGMDYTNNNGSNKGEGLDARSTFLQGRGNYVNGGGGGNAANAGGGGGGNGGAGGIGGRQNSFEGFEPNTRGLFGVDVAFDPAERLIFGGGGGAGQQNDGLGGAGGDAGGIIVVFARHLTGDGDIEANGQDGEIGGDPGDNGDGAGGGGAGGTVWIRVETTDFTGDIEANGGNGGDTRTDLTVLYGPGGGGGGGQIFLEGISQSVGTAAAGMNGGNTDNNDDTFDSAPGADGRVLAQ